MGAKADGVEKMEVAVQKVWLVLEAVDHEGMQVVGVYSTKERAHEVATGLAQKYLGGEWARCDEVMVEGWVLDGPLAADVGPWWEVRVSGPRKGEVASYAWE